MSVQYFGIFFEKGLDSDPEQLGNPVLSTEKVVEILNNNGVRDTKNLPNMMNTFFSQEENRASQSIFHFFPKDHDYDHLTVVIVREWH
jgi:hypothetical protein